MPNEAPISEADAKEVEFESVDENEWFLNAKCRM
jgi:hypothetical protein